MTNIRREVRVSISATAAAANDATAGAAPQAVPHRQHGWQAFAVERPEG